MIHSYNLKKLAAATLLCLSQLAQAQEGGTGITAVRDSLEDQVLVLDDVVVVGYSSTTKRDLISSVSQVKAGQISNLPTTSISQGLAGRSPGLIVTERGGGANVDPAISIRGGSNPLFVIDGIIRTKADFVALSPEDIEQLNILKDASATAIYGARASNGIIQVVTKKGSVGKVTVEYDFTQSYAQPAYWQKTNRLWKRYEFANQASINDGLEPQYTPEIIEKAKNGLDAMGRPMQVSRDIVLKDWAPQSKHSIRINSGNEYSQTYISFGYVDNNSLYKVAENYLKRATFRVANTVNIKNIGLQINTSVDGYVQRETQPWSNIDPGYRTAFADMQNAPEAVLLNKYGLPLTLGNINIIAELSDDSGYYRTKNNLINAKAEAVWDIPGVKGLKAKLSADYRYNIVDAKEWGMDPATYEWDSQTPRYAGNSKLNKDISQLSDYTTQAFLEYAGTFGKHSVSAVGGYEQFYERGDQAGLGRKDYEFRVDQINVGPASKQTNYGSEAEMGRAAWIFQGRYNYDRRFYFEGSLRYDGSDYFAPGKRWGAFFGGSLGWIVTAEEWMKPLVDRNILNMLKLRASYGQTGLDSSAGRFAYLQKYRLESKGYVVDNEYVPGFFEGDLPSPDLTWYTTDQTDIGFDFASAKNRLYGSFDYFYYKTHGYLVSPTGQSYLNVIMGVGMPKVKSDSEHRREGIEIQMGWRSNIGEFSYDISANFTYFDQMWAYDQSEAEASYMNPYTRAQQTRGYYGNLYHSLGYYRDQDDVFNSVAYLAGITSGALAPGDIKYEDTNGDGQINSEDYRHLGKSSMPRGQYGINIALGYKGFYFNSLLQGSTTANLYISATNSMQTLHAGNLTTIYPYQEDTWTPTNQNAAYPRLMYNTNLNSNNNYLSSDFWLLNCAYLRIKDVQFGYDFKYALLKNAKWVSRLRVGVSGQNLVTFSKAKKYGMDPENVDASGYGYPVSRTLALTINVGF
jgi:TonB-linked SusC/RagA family outer membrane protein